MWCRTGGRTEEPLLVLLASAELLIAQVGGPYFSCFDSTFAMHQLVRACFTSSRAV